ncbi:MAG: hypothetical protein GX621_16570 [Pirellulaceae bacterium]|nr:hypothetical protein [Pirellulaceae bacterium]
MTHQPTLFDPPAVPDPPHSGPATSQAAAASIRHRAAKIRSIVAAFIAGRGFEGATDCEVSEALDIAADTTRARRVELRDAGDVIDSGRRRPTRSGRAAIVWVTPEHYFRENIAGVARPTRTAATRRPSIDAATCPHSKIIEHPTHDGYLNRECAACGEWLRCRKADQKDTSQ